MRKNKKFTISISALATLFTAFAIANIKDINLNLLKATHIHNGYHYEEKEAGYDTPGHKEFWVCCACHEVFLEKPVSGTFVDQDDSYMTGGLDISHPAYLPPSNEGGYDGNYWIKDDFGD